MSDRGLSTWPSKDDQKWPCKMTENAENCKRYFFLFKYLKSTTRFKVWSSSEGYYFDVFWLVFYVNSSFSVKLNLVLTFTVVYSVKLKKNSNVYSLLVSVIFIRSSWFSHLNQPRVTSTRWEWLRAWANIRIYFFASFKFLQLQIFLHVCFVIINTE